MVANLLIEEPPVFKIVDDYYNNYLNNSNDGGNGLMGDSVAFDKRTKYCLYDCHAIWLSYFSRKSNSITDVTPDTPQYTSNLWMSLPGTKSNYNILNNESPLKITKFEVKKCKPRSNSRISLINQLPLVMFFTYGEQVYSDILTGNKTIASDYSADNSQKN